MKKYVWVEPSYGVEMGVPSGRAPARFVGFDPRPATPIWNELQFVQQRPQTTTNLLAKNATQKTGLRLPRREILLERTGVPFCATRLLLKPVNHRHAFLRALCALRGS